MLISLNELDNKRSCELIPLECYECHNTFHKEKHYVLSFLKRNAGGLFCSSKCSYKHYDKRILTECFLCHKEIKRSRGEFAEKNFCSRKCTAMYYGDLIKKSHPPKPPKIKKERLPFFTIPCSFCKKEIKRQQYQINRSKTKTFFCNKSCKTQYLHKFQIKHKPRSRAEKYLVSLIKKDFPSINLLENYRNLLSNNLEIDIYLPDYKLCIELNGPVHYFPIWGQEKLDCVHNKDIQKQIEITQLQLNLMVIDISKLNSNRKTINFLDEYYISHIKPILDSKVEIGCGQRV